MIAWAGAERLELGLTDGLDVSPRARWPLAEVKHAIPRTKDLRRRRGCGIRQTRDMGIAA